MKNAIILHGSTDKEEYYSGRYPSMSNSHWLPWLQKHLLLRDIHAVTPEIIRVFEPDYQRWKREFERYDINPDTILVGHSAGGGFLVRWLSENSEVRVGNVVLVAPWLDPGHELTGDFYKFIIDVELEARTGKLVLFRSDDEDVPGVLESCDFLESQIKNLRVREFKGYGHFIIGDMSTEEFPELLEEVLS